MEAYQRLEVNGGLILKSQKEGECVCVYVCVCVTCCKHLLVRVRGVPAPSSVCMFVQRRQGGNEMSERKC